MIRPVPVPSIDWRGLRSPGPVPWQRRSFPRVVHPTDLQHQETSVKSAVETLEPHPGQADRRGALRGAQAEPRRGVPEDREADQRPRLPQRQGPAGGHRPPGRPRSVLDEAINAVAPEAVHAGAAGERPRSRWPSRRSRSPSSRTTSPSSSPPRSTSSPTSSCPPYDGLEARSTTSRSPTPTSTSRSRRCASASAPWTRSSVPPPTATSSPSTCRLQGRRDRRGRRGHRHVLQGRPRRHARRPRRGPASASPPASDDDVQLRARSAATWWASPSRSPSP